jgi:orotidine-5'-phosphate decarboxylase
MMQAAKEAADRARDRTGHRPLVIAVTVLTSFDQAMLDATGVNRPIAAQVEHLATLTKEAGLDGVVASPHEIDAIRARCGADFLVVTPGIRTGLAAPGDDQVRTRSAREAMDAGASYLVVGRPILKAADPAAAAKEIADSLGIRT